MASPIHSAFQTSSSRKRDVKMRFFPLLTERPCCITFQCIVVTFPYFLIRTLNIHSPLKNTPSVYQHHHNFFVCWIVSNICIHIALDHAMPFGFINLWTKYNSTSLLSSSTFYFEDATWPSTSLYYSRLFMYTPLSSHDDHHRHHLLRHVIVITIIIAITIINMLLLHTNTLANTQCWATS